MALPNPFRSVRSKLVAFMTVLMALVAMSIFVFFPSRLEDQAIESVTKKASTVAEMTAFALGAGDHLQSPGNVKVILDASAQVEDLVYAMVSDPDGAVVSEINRNPMDFPAAAEVRKPGGISQRGNIYRIHRAIVSDGTVIGRLHVAISLAPLTSEMTRSRRLTAAASVTIFLLGILGVYVLGRVITAPLKEIVRIADRISEGDLNERVQIKTNDELGKLGRSFNQMVDSLKIAYQQLESANSTLAYHSQDLQAEVAQKRKAEEAMRASEAKFRAVVEHATDVVAVLDENGRIRYMSPASIQMMGVAPEFLIDSIAGDHLHDADRDAFERALSRGSEGKAGVIEVEARWRHANGMWRYLAFRGRDLEGFAGIDGLLFNVTDVTDTKRVQTELMLAKEKAEGMVVLKDTFLTNMSHEIRTPLTGILGFAQILRSELDDEHLELVEHIQRSGQRLLNTLNAVLDLAELEALSARPELESVAVSYQVRETAHIVAPVAQLKNLTVTLELPNDEVYALANGNCLQRALTNLASNAVKFTEEGGVTISVRAEQSHIAITVSDTGVGISSEFMPTLFSEFTQESTGNARLHEGSGLGLAITRRLIDLMNGTISVESQKGRGTRFIVTLPLAETNASHVSPVRMDRAAGPSSLKAVRLSSDRKAS